MIANKRGLTIHDLTEISSYSDPQFSPDEKTYAFVSTKINKKKQYEANLYIQHVDEEAPIQWTTTSDHNSHPRFSPDGKAIAFVSNRSGLPQIWLLPTNGGEAKQITFFKHGANQPFWTSDGKSIIFSAPLAQGEHVQDQQEETAKVREKRIKAENKQPQTIKYLKYKSDAGGLRDERNSQIIAYDLGDQSFTQLTTRERHHQLQDVSPCGSKLIFSANPHDDKEADQWMDLYLLDIHSKTSQKLTKSNGTYRNTSFSPDGKAIAYFGHDFSYEGATLTELYIMDLSNKQTTCLSEGWDFQLSDMMASDVRYGTSHPGPFWSTDAQKLYFIGSTFGRTKLFEVTRQKELNVIYENNDHLFSVAYAPKNHTFILGISTPTDPCNFYLLKEDQLQQMTDANKTLKEKVAFVTPEELLIPIKDDLKVQGWLLKPPTFDPEKKYPLILQIHGGPHVMYGQTFFHEMQLLAAKGYVVLYTNPRGSHGYGQEFVNAVRGNYGSVDYVDLMAAVDYAIDRYSFIDQERLGVTGGSYGGFMTNWIVGHTNRFRAAVTQRSISNWLSFYGVSDIGYFFTKWEHGFDLLDDPEKLWEYSPLKYAQQVETPLLILHSEKDLRCPIEQAEQLFITLKHADKEVEFIRFPGANHDLSRDGQPELRIERLKHILRWFDHYL